MIGKGLRDQNSEKVFRELIQNRSFDLQHAFTFTGVPEAFSTAMKNGEGFASMAQRISKSFDSASKKILDAIDQN